MIEQTQRPKALEIKFGARFRDAATWIDAIRRYGIKDITAGCVASVVLIANIISFGALMFPGELSAGIPIAIWAMLIGSCLGGLFIALGTSLPPLATGIDSPTGAVLVLLGAAVSHEVFAEGGSTEAAIEISMLLFSCATFLSGASLYVLGHFKWGAYFRFVPYSVVAGFLAATGIFLMLGGVRMAIGRSLTASPFGNWTITDATKLIFSFAALGIFLALRRWVKSGVAMPTALILMWLFGSLALQYLVASETQYGWYLPALGSLRAWQPLNAAQSTHLTSSQFLISLPELIAVVLVAIVSLVTKVSSLEVARQVPGDLDQEFRAHGLGNLIAFPFGGLASSLQTGTSRLLEHAGGATRMSGVASAIVLGIVGVTNFNLAGIIPIPIIVGLVFFLGYTFIVDALWRPYAQRAWLDLILALTITVICVLYGYLVGVLGGVVCACVLFALSYARFGVVRRHVTREQFSSYVARPHDSSKYLRERGAAVHIYWLSGHIFFGSAESLFERVRGDIEALPPKDVSYVILDFGLVSGADTSAIASITKLRNFCAKRGIMIAYSSTSPAVNAGLRRGGCFGGKSPKEAFADLNLALAWCEDQLLLNAADITRHSGTGSFENWLQTQLGSEISWIDLFNYLDVKETVSSERIYRQGDAADSLDIVAKGTLVVDVTNELGETTRVRRINTHSVVGEMGFFRHSLRSATVSSDGPATLYTLTRTNFERMRQDHPRLASAFDDFIICILADRIDSANRSVTALNP